MMISEIDLVQYFFDYYVQWDDIGCTYALDERPS